MPPDGMTTCPRCRGTGYVSGLFAADANITTITLRYPERFAFTNCSSFEFESREPSEVSRRFWLGVHKFLGIASLEPNLLPIISKALNPIRSFRSIFQPRW